MAQKKGNVSKETLTGAAIGTVVGAGLGAAAVALSDKKTRRTIVKKGAAVTEKANKTVVSLPKQTLKRVEEGREALAKVSSKQLTTKKKTVKKTAAKRTTKSAKK